MPESRVTGGENKQLGVSVMNILLCLGVVFIHVCSEFILQGDGHSVRFQLVGIPHYLAGFVMQGFVFLSGLKLTRKYKSRPLGYGPFVLERFRKIYLPYVLWVVVYYAYFALFRGYFPFSLRDLVLYIIRGDISSPFYFIVVIMQCYLLMPVWMLMVRRVHPAVGACLALLVTTVLGASGLFPYQDRVFTTYLAYWVIGCYAGWYAEGASAVLRENRYVLYAACLVGVLAEAYFRLRGGAPGAMGALRLAYCLTAVMSLYTLTLGAKGSWLERVTDVTDKLTFGVFLGHCLLMNVVNAALTAFGVTRLGHRLVLRAVAVYIGSFFLVWLYTRAKARLLRRGA